MKSNDLDVSVTPAGYLHRLHTECGDQVAYRDTKQCPFGKPGVDYDPSYTVSVTPLFEGAGYTAVDMTTAAAQGFRDGVASVVVKLPKRIHIEEKDWTGSDWFKSDDVIAAIIAAGGSVKE